MAMIKKGGSHGLWKILAQRIGTDGISRGLVGDSLSSGSGSPAYVIDTPVDASLPIPDRTKIDFKGGDHWITSFQYGIDSMNDFNFNIQETDADLIALVTGSSVDQTSNDEWTQYSEDQLSSTRPAMSLMFIYRIQSFEPATFGQTFYVHSIVPRCLIAPTGHQSNAYQSPTGYGFQVTPSAATRRLNGPAFGSNINVANNTLAVYHIIAENPLYMYVYQASGASVTAVAPYKPISSAVGSAASTKNHIVKKAAADDAITAGVADTITPVTGTFEVGTALTTLDGDLLTFLYESAYEAVA